MGHDDAQDVPQDYRGRIERWEAEKGAAVEVIFQRVADGETLKGVCKSRRWPYSVVARWVGETPEAAKAYRLALELWADALATETVGIADRTDATEVGLGKLQTDVRLKVASRLHRERYGDRVEINGMVKHQHSLIAILSGMTAHAPEGLIEAAPVEEVTARLVPPAEHEMI